jgi:DHA1 family L-arabinose/isopropyl-beta-D-thiogalactopyranoside export protein-like MFS transporter
VLLLILGGAGIIGSILFGKLGNQHASGLISIAIGLLLACLLLLLPASQNAPPDAAQHLLGRGDHDYRSRHAGESAGLAPDATDVAMSLFSGSLISASARARWSAARSVCIFRWPRSATSGRFRRWWRLVLMIFRRWPVSLEDHQPHHS